MIKVVIDTNVLVSAIWNPMGSPAKIIEAVYAGTLEPIISEQILQEYSTVLKYKEFNFQPNIVNQMLNYFRVFLLPLPPENTSIKCNDPDNTKFLSAAIAGNASYIITGNRKHFPRKVPELTINNPQEMLNILDKWTK